MLVTREEREKMAAEMSKSVIETYNARARELPPLSVGDIVRLFLSESVTSSGLKSLCESAAVSDRHCSVLVMCD